MRIRFRFGLRWLLILPVAVGVILSLEQRRAYQQREVEKQLTAINGRYVKTHRPYVPVKICDMLPDEYGQTITEVTFGGMAAPTKPGLPMWILMTPRIQMEQFDIRSKQTLTRIARLPAMRKVQSFRLVGTSVDDELATSIAQLPNCDSVKVYWTAVTENEYYPKLPAAAKRVNGRWRSGFQPGVENGAEALKFAHRDALDITNDIQLFARAFEEDPQAIGKLLNLSPPMQPRHPQASDWIIVSTLSHLTSPESIAIVRRALKHPNPNVRHVAIQVLAHCRDAAGLIEGLNDDHTSVRTAAIHGAKLLPTDTERFDRLVESMTERLNETDPAVRWTVMNWLADTGDKRCFDAFVDGLSDHDSAIRSAAARGMGILGDSRAKPHLEKAISDPDTFVRRHAKKSLEVLNGR